jgi:non-ribosomal peptide synthetase-like protein
MSDLPVLTLAKPAEAMAAMAAAITAVSASEVLVLGQKLATRIAVGLENQSPEQTSSEPLGSSQVIWHEGCLHAMFEAQSSSCGDAPAIIRDGLVLSYSEVEGASNRLARHLRSVGAGRGSLIGLCLNRSERPIIAILACLKAGAAYLPIDPAHPDDRVRYIVEEAEASVIICEDALIDRIRPMFDGPIVSLDSDAAEIAARSTERLAQNETGITPADLCYVIYTSGTSGRPKGVLTEHRNAFHFVQAFNAVCMTTSSDRIYQGFSLSFDGSVEEIWMAFSNGAALVVGSKDAPRFGNDLSQYLARAEVTYFSTVPTMLSTMTEDIPTLRQLVVSGEVCPPELVARWSRVGRSILNVYGPTEATVNSTAKICLPGEAINIGRPLAGYSTLIVDPDMRPLPRGSQGELCIGGAGVCRGYLKRIELTSRHFVPSTFGTGRIYRTGDLAAINESGEVEYFGRIDDQVKIRGYRVEPAEIASILLEQDNIASAAVVAHDRAGVPALAAYVVAQDRRKEIDRAAVLSALKAKLPEYMIPSYLDSLDELPMLATGKVDRKRLPLPALPLLDEPNVGAPANELEAKITDSWAATFGLVGVGVEQDFFLDLGGHSLLAAQAVALLRSRADLHIAVRDIYAYPTVRRLAAHLASATAPIVPDSQKEEARPSRRAPGLGVGALQGCLLIISWYVLSTPSLIVLPIADHVLRDRISILAAAIILVLFYLALWPIWIALGIAAKWLIIGRYKPGVYRLWGSYYLRWWLASGLQRLFDPSGFVGTPLMPLYYRLMGAKVGRGCALDSALVSAWDLVAVGDYTSIGVDTQLHGARVENGYLVLGRIDIGSRCFVGAHSALGLNVGMSDESRLDDQSLLPDGATLAPGEQRCGSPAKALDVSVPEGPIYRASLRRLLAFVVLSWLIGGLVNLSSLGPGFVFLWLWLLAFRHGLIWFAAWATIGLAPILVVVTCLWIAALKTILLRRAKPGVYPLYSFYYLQNWLSYGLMRSSRALLLPIFTTIFLPPWMRLLGAKVGKHAEMSTVWSFMPELLDAGDSTFFADGCMLGGRRVFGGRFQLGVNRVRDRSFVGNGAILPAGASLGERCLLGVLSAPPSSAQAMPNDTDWLGSPAFQLPNRQKVLGFGDSTTYRPNRKLYAQRAVVDALRILIPSYTALLIFLSGLTAVLYAYEVYGLGVAYALLPALGLLAAAVAVLIVVALKWAVMGCFKPVIKPLWSPYVWFNEMVNGAYESIMAPVVSSFFGTPFAAPLLRLLGCKIGRHCYIATGLFSEFDLVQIGDYVALNPGAVIQNHLFEDRIMKSSHLTIENGCSVGNMSVVLYDSRMCEGATLGPLSLLLKGEVMPAGSRWYGIPTVQG